MNIILSMQIIKQLQCKQVPQICFIRNSANSNEIIKFGRMYLLLHRKKLGIRNQYKFKYNMQEKEDKVPLTPSEKEIQDILTNKIQYDEQPYSQQLYQTDLVIKIKYPQDKYIPRKNEVPLGSFINKPPVQLVHAYKQSFSTLYKDMEDVGDSKEKGKDTNVLRLRNATSFEEVRVKDGEEQPFAYKKLNLKGSQDKHISLFCQQFYTGKLDAFIIQINTLIYVLQKLCGFSIRTFLINERKIQANASRNDKSRKKNNTKNDKKTLFLLLTQKKTNLLKAANIYKIKKQIDYTQFDLYLNNPMDSKGRPIKLHSHFKREEDQEFHEKYINRRLGAKKENASLQKNIVDEATLSSSEIQKYGEFMRELTEYTEDLLGRKDTPLMDPNVQDEDALTEEERQYLGEFNVAKKDNIGVHKLYFKIKKKRKYFAKISQLCDRHGFHVYEPPKTFMDFSLANKRKKFLQRWSSFLFYKESIVNPYGDLNLFNRMERIKLSYLILKQYIRVQNLHMLNGQLFALNNNFQKSGEVKNQIDPREIKPEIKGGIDGKNLVSAWPKWIWFIDLKTCRNYLGQAPTYQILIKSSILNFFLMLIPFGIGGQVLKKFVVQPAIPLGNFYFQFGFNLIYFCILIIFYNIFIASIQYKGDKFQSNYMETNKSITFRYQFKGPYTRNTTTDGVNQYIPKKTLSSSLARILFNLLLFGILGLQIGFYVGIRRMMVVIAQQFPSFDRDIFYLLYPARFFGYLVFFVVNAFLYPLVIVPFTKWLTQLENIPTQEDFKQSHDNKLYIFSLGVELIGPLDLVFISPFSKSSCLTNWCYTELLAYIYCRYFIIFGLLIFKIIYNFIKGAKNIEIFSSNEKTSFQQKLADYLVLVQKESKKKQANFKLIDQTVALFLYCIFGLAFPLAPAFSFLLMYLDYFFERRQILQNSKRPISKSEFLQNYAPKAKAILHWMIFFNLASLWISLEWMQYLFQDIVFQITPVPTIASMLTLKVFTIFIFMIFYELVGFLTRTAYRSFRDIRFYRKIHKIARMMETGNRTAMRLAINLLKPKPLRSISRTFNTFSKAKRNDESEGQEDDMDEVSSIISSRSKIQ